MLTPKQATASILERIRPTRTIENVDIADALGRVLASEVASDIDLPPFEKSAMDGYAVHSADFGPLAASEKGGKGSSAGPASDPASDASIERTLPIVGESRAGNPLRDPVPMGACAAIYTGAEVPAGCDAVVMVEHSKLRGGEVTLIGRPRPGQHICQKGQDLRRGQVVLQPGHRVRPADLAVLAAVGAVPVRVFARPIVAILTTGDELLPPDQTPGPGQIREGNTLHLAAMVQAAGAVPRNLGVCPDELDELARAISGALEGCDALITTGGVSMGRYDLVGEALEKVGVECVFHKVSIKPGKPLWFGMRGGTPVFALPGNPVSCLVGFEVFVRPALLKMSAEEEPSWTPPRRSARWNGPDAEPNSREQYLPARILQARDGSMLIEPVPWNGSADIVGLSRASALAVAPADRALVRGELVEFCELP
jgi:molybdopterin molybdotransferase